MKFTSLLLILVVTIAWANWIDFGTSDIGNASLDVVEITASSFTVDVTLPGFSNSVSTRNGLTFNTLSVPALTPYAEFEGAPMLPKASFMAAVPDNHNISITVEPLERAVVLQGINPSPMQPIPADNSYEPVPFTYSAEAYSHGTYPAVNAVFEQTGTIRGVNIGRFNILPFQWDAETGTLTVTPRMRVTVDFGASLSFDQRLNSRFFSNTFRTLVNADLIGEPNRTISSTSSLPVKAYNRRQADDITEADLLIIAGDDFVDTMMDAFINAKMDQGYLTAIVGAGTWSTSEIHSYIQNAYDNWAMPPSFVLFVGDSDDVLPIALSFSYSDSVWADNRYLCMDGSGDYHSDIYYGRMVTSSSNYPFVEDKILKWEFDPLMDSSFWNNGLCAGMLQATGNTATRWFCFTCETVRDTYQNIYGKTFNREYVKDTSSAPPYYYRSDLPSAGQMVPSDIVWDGDAAGILSSMNDGVFLVQHRDHGGVSGWGDPAFYISDLAGLSNGYKTPMVMSVNCLTGKFVSNCFAENLLAMEGGAVGVFAATAVSYSYWNDYLCYGLYKSFNDEYTSPPSLYTDPTGNYLTGQAVMCAKIEMDASAPMCPYPTNRAEIEWDMFQWFGDPTMDMRTDVPHAITVQSPYYLPSGSTSALFIVTDTNGPVDKAMVCIQHTSGLWASGVTSSDGTVTLTFDAIGAISDITYMVTAHNALPNEGSFNGVGVEETSAGIVTASVGSPYPNPATSSVTFPITLDGAGNVSIAVFDITGRSVKAVESEELESGSHALVWNVAEVPQGIYMARIIDPRGSVTTRRVVIAR